MKGSGKQLQGNISELTAIARVKPGDYPENRLKLEIKSESEGQKKWLATQPVTTFEKKRTWLQHLKANGNQPRMTWLEHLKAVLAWSHDARQDQIRKMSTIHYARWVILDKDILSGIDGPHLLFTSNYDGIFKDYLEDFSAIDEGPLNLIFGHCVDWPGARPAGQFIKYVRKHQIQADIFYANYPKVRVEEVNRAVDWKIETEKFIQNDLPRLRGKSSSTWEHAIDTYLYNLAMPNSKRVMPINE